jgi:hypothetical protein
MPLEWVDEVIEDKAYYANASARLIDNNGSTQATICKEFERIICKYQAKSREALLAEAMIANPKLTNFRSYSLGKKVVHVSEVVLWIITEKTEPSSVRVVI